jgi:hypothetical protein
MGSSNKRMFSPAQVAVASLIGSPLPAFYLIARNFRIAGYEKQARLMLIVGGIATASLLVIAFMLRDRSPHSLLSIAATVCVHQIAKTAQAALISQHRANGGRLSSWWLAIGIGFLGMLVILAILVAFELALAE